jgi:dephospho-CoA kinase
MLKAGLTGNIGSGKSTASNIFTILGIPVFDADYHAKSLLSNPAIKSQLSLIFGTSIFLGDEIDRKKLASIVFNDKTALEKLNSVIHPAVRIKFEQWTGQNSQKPYVVYEAAIIFESGFNQQLDQMIMISASEEIRLKRVMKRDQASKEMVLSRMKNQWTDDKKCSLADFVIFNNYDELLIPQVLKVHQKLLELSKTF